MCYRDVKKIRPEIEYEYIQKYEDIEKKSLKIIIKTNKTKMAG